MTPSQETVERFTKKFRRLYGKRVLIPSGLTREYVDETDEIIEFLSQELQKAEDRAKIEGKIETEEEWKQAFIMTGQERNARNADNSIRLLKEKLESLKKES